MYKLQIMVDEQWLDILSKISENQEGFVWEDVDYEEDSACCHCGRE